MYGIGGKTGVYNQNSLMGQSGLKKPPVFKQLSMGFGINQNEYMTIVQAITNAYMLGMRQMSALACSYIKSMIGGEWFVFINQVGEIDYNFGLTMVARNDFISFQLDNFIFQVCRIR